MSGDGCSWRFMRRIERFVLPFRPVLLQIWWVPLTPLLLRIIHLVEARDLFISRSGCHSSNIWASIICKSHCAPCAQLLHFMPTYYQ